MNQSSQSFNQSLFPFLFAYFPHLLFLPLYIYIPTIFLLLSPPFTQSQLHLQILLIKMNLQDCLDFCNRYLLSSVALAEPPKASFVNKKTTVLKKQPNPKRRRNHKFQQVAQPHRQAKQRSPQPSHLIHTPKVKKPKFEQQAKTPPKKVHQYEQPRNQIQIDDLLNELCVRTLQKPFQKNQSNIRKEEFYQFFPSSVLSKEPENQENIKKIFESNFRNQSPYQSKRPMTPPPQSQKISFPFFQNHEENIFRNQGSYVPTERTPISQLKNLQNFSENRSNLTTPKRNKAEKSKQRDFFMVNKTEGKKESGGKPNLMQKFEKQLQEQKIVCQFTKSASNTNTKMEEKYDEEISLNSKVRQSLTFLSQMRNPPQPISIQIKRS